MLGFQVFDIQMVTVQYLDPQRTVVPFELFRLIFNSGRFHPLAPEVFLQDRLVQSPHEPFEGVGDIVLGKGVASDMNAPSVLTKIGQQFVDLGVDA